MSSHYVRALGCLAFVALYPSCLTTIHPRPAEIVAPGELTWDAHLPLTTVDFADARAVGVDQAGQTRQLHIGGPSLGLMDADSGGGAGIIPFWWEFSGRIGLFRPCELGPFLGVFRQGGEVRCGLLTRNRPFVMAASAGAAYLPFFHTGGPWMRGGFDFSRRFGLNMAMLNLYASYGPEERDLGHSVPVEFQPPVDDNVSNGGSPNLFIVRREWRLASALGWGFLESYHGVAFVVGVVPHFVLRAEEVTHTDCAGCNVEEVTGLTRGGGFTVTLGITDVL